ncbi:hypothetical protein CBR_g23881 [Chara braunii]|uniref:Myb-like domain-containing protein n=1 Tax=Chara braunii TaxID=69332 RepID=A0A388L5B1_CHABU|nr:hypothetical protein CBR_g23881 [Chara braunii]|eukprot:GBG77432.1 hypothetical protein CBR_g23881 [Chara braunii]
MSHETSELAVGGPWRWSPAVVPLHCAKRKRAVQISVASVVNPDTGVAKGAAFRYHLSIVVASKCAMDRRGWMDDVVGGFDGGDNMHDGQLNARPHQGQHAQSMWQRSTAQSTCFVSCHCACVQASVVNPDTGVAKGAAFRYCLSVVVASKCAMDRGGWMDDVVGGFDDGDNMHDGQLNARPHQAYNEGTGGSEAGDEDGQAEQGTAVPMVASWMGGQGDVNGQGAGGGAVGGRPANGRPPAQKKPNVPWTLDERVKLAIFMGEDDALMADANDQHRFKQRKDRYAWVNDRMADAGFKHMSGEDCRKKWSNMLATAKLIVEKCEESGQPSYWDMSTEERKEKSLSLSFEKAVWDAMQWQLNRSSIRCDNTLTSENLPSVGTDATPAGGSDGRCAEESDNSAKSRRTTSGKARKEDPGSSVSSLGRAMDYF